MADFSESKLQVSSYHLPPYLCEPYEDKIYTIRKILNTNATDINILLHIAVENDEEEAIKMLYECGANMEVTMVNDQTPETGWTPVCRAAYYGHVDAIEMLHECGADVNKADAEGRTPVFLAAKNGHVDVITMLHKCGADVITSDSIALYKKYSDDLNKLKECGFSDDVVAKNKKLEEEEEENLYMKYVKDKKFKFLTRKYLSTILERIEFMTSQGNKETYINFNRDDFKANCNGLGFPRQFQRMWLMEMQNPKSVYLPALADGSKPSLEGIRFDIWGNRKYTTHFKWDLKKN